MLLQRGHGIILSGFLRGFSGLFVSFWSVFGFSSSMEGVLGLSSESSIGSGFAGSSVIEGGGLSCSLSVGFCNLNRICYKYS